VILVSSLGAHAAVGTLSAYAATKGAIDTLVKYFAASLGPRGISRQRGRAGRDRHRHVEPRQDDEGKSFVLGMQALKRIGQPMMSARLWRSSPRKTRVGSPATPSAWMAARSSEVGGNDRQASSCIRCRPGRRCGFRSASIDKRVYASN